MQYLKEDVRKKIYQAAVEEFREFGYANASIRNIATNAEVSVGNVYRYFSDKEALYLAIVNPFIDELNFYITENLKPSRISSAENCINGLVHFLLDHRDEIIISRKSDKQHYDKYVSVVVEMASKKIKEVINLKVQDVQKYITNPKFYDIIAQSYIYALFKVVRSDDPYKVQEKKCKELTTFFFGNLKERFSNFEN